MVWVSPNLIEDQGRDSHLQPDNVYIVFPSNTREATSHHNSYSNENVILDRMRILHTISATHPLSLGHEKILMVLNVLHYPT